MKRNTPLFFTLFAAIVFCATVSQNVFAKTESSRLYLKSGLEVMKQPVVEVEEDPVLSAHGGLGVLVRADCEAGQTINPGEQCTYPGTSFTFSVAADGRATFWVTSAGSGGTIDSRNSTLNGISVNFLAIGNADGSWFLQEVGDDVAVTVGVTVSETALTVTEEDATGDTYTVVLDSEPTANVVVTVGGHSSTDVTPAPATLTFTNLNWETAQTVTVTAGNDADTANDTVSLTHSATSTDSDYSGISIAGVTVTVNDNDTGQVTGVMVEPGDTELVVEWTAVGNATGYKVQWKSGGQSYNTSDRQATIASGSTTSYTITSLTNDTEYTVQVTATRTGFNDGPPSAEVTATPESVTVADCQAGQTINPGEQCTYPGTTTTFSVAADGGATFGFSSAGSGSTISVLNTTINGQLYNLVATGNSDGSWFLNRVGDDIAGTAGVTVSETALTVTEEDATGDTYTVVLDSEPTANVVVTVAGHSGTDVTANPATLTFTSMNWETAQTVTVKAGNDADTANDTVSLTHSAASTDSDYSGISIAGVTVTVNDNDTVQPTGICGRTEQVRDGILARISGITNCADVTATHLAGITQLLLSDENITALAAGDFDGLTSLRGLDLGTNSLSTLPADVFDGLTALSSLYLNFNSLSSLPAGVFDELTALTWLFLNNNSLSTLPAGVFDELTALTTLSLNNNSLSTLPAGVFEDLTPVFLYLGDNPGAPFAPTADALPDDGKVPVAGGTVTLDGSGSDGGPWGTNVSYSWALTSPASGVTVPFVYDSNGLPTYSFSTTPVVRIPALTDGAELTFTLTVTGRIFSGGASTGIAPDTDTATVTVEASPVNASPSFTSPATFNAPENQTAVGTVAASDSDTDDSVTGYAIQGGADRSKFSLAPATGALTFASAPNFEAPADADTGNDYVVVVRATSGAGAREKTADQTITVTVTDVAGEAPGVPVAPSVSSASATSLNVSWTVPANAGPAITDYDYRHRVTSPQGSWTEVTNTTITALGATITQLAENTEYDVQVRATNGEGTSGWSGSGSGSTDANAAPSFTSPATFSAAENQTAAGTVAASDSDTDDSVTGYAIQGGADRSKFSLAASTGVLTFASAPNFEAPADTDAGNDYVVVVRATSGTGARVKTADQTITVTVTNVAGEAPGVPAAPSVSSASATSLNVSWTAPTNTGPAITDYDYRHRATSPQGSWTEVTTTTITALSATIGQLAENAGYDVQVRATNDEGTGDWSGSGSGSTDANAAPSFTSPATFNAAENRAAVGTVAASDSDTGDSVTGYAIQGGADASKFSIAPASGALTFASAPNFEAPADADTGNDYVVVVRATSGAGARVKTADQAITVTVTDMDGEAPGVPAALVVSSASATSVTAAWIAPANAGPPITDYDYRYRVTLLQGSWTEVTTTTITALSVTIGELTEDTEYDVQVRATNDEGTSGWSDSGTGTPTRATEAGAIANAPENLQATAGDAEVTLRWDAPLNDSGADITGYAYRYKESGGDFIAYTDIPESGPGQANARSYTVPGLTNGVEYVFHVRAVNEHGGGLPAEVVVMLPGIVSSESEELPAEVTLSANYPNPFNPETTIRYALPQAGQVHLVVYDLLGHEVEILVEGSKPAGDHTVRFGADNLPSGLYVYRLHAQGKTIVRTMMLVK